MKTRRSHLEIKAERIRSLRLRTLSFTEIIIVVYVHHDESASEVVHWSNQHKLFTLVVDAESSTGQCDQSTSKEHVHFKQ
jgi:hypothetical protein